jgi:RHS repeat-associated protein
MTLRVDGRGPSTTYGYDAVDRLTELMYQNGNIATMTYDAISRRTVLADWTGLYTATYDRDDRLTGCVGPTAIPLTYTYDAVGQRALLIQPTGSFTYVFDPAGRISALTNPEGGCTSWSYDSASRVTAYHLANGTRASYAYDSASRVLRLANLGPGGVTLSSSTYRYDAANNRTQVIGSDSSVTSWTYDNTYQLTAEIRSVNNLYAVTYTYDPRGNRATRWDGSTLETLTYDAANQLTAILTTGGSSTYAYDGCGNLVQGFEPGQLNAYTWDGENRMVEAALSTGVVDTFTYNGDGQRVGKTDQGGPVNYVWDGQNVLIEANASNVIEAVHTLEPAFYGNQLSQRRSGTTSYYHFDALGSTLQLTGSTGTVTDSYLYRAFGDLVASSGSTVNPYQYVGRKGYIYDGDLDNFQVRARRYDPTMGRWWGRDPIGLAGGDANLYRYVENSATSFSDPSGLVGPVLKEPIGPESEIGSSAESVEAIMGKELRSGSTGGSSLPPSPSPRPVN